MSFGYRVSSFGTALLVMVLTLLSSVEQHLIVNNDADPETLDPALATGVTEDRVLRALCEGLITPDPQTLEPRPGLAASWEISPDGMEYTFHLREGLRWSDGSALTAADLRRSWLRVLTPETASDYAYLLDAIAGAADFRTGTGSAEDVALSALDARTFAVRLARPCPWFLELCGFPLTAPVPEQPVREFASQWTQPEHFVGSGPFMLETWEPRARLVVRRNPHWRDAASVRLERITFYVHDNSETAWKLYQAGDLHWLPTIPLPRLDEIRFRPDYYVGPYFGTYFYRFNVTQPPFDDVHVRRAVALAIDRVAITSEVTRAGQLPSGAYGQPVGGYTPPPGPTCDIAAARSELALSRYVQRGEGVPPIELLFNTSEQHQLIGELVVQQLRSALGLTINLRTCEWKTYLAAQSALDYQMTRASWIGDYGDPDTFYSCFLSGGGNNRTGWADPEYDRLVRAAGASADAAERWRLYAQAEQRLVSEACPIVCIYRYIAQGVLAPQVRGFTPNFRDLRLWQHYWLAD